MKKAGVFLFFLSFLVAVYSCHKSEPIPKANFVYEITSQHHDTIPCTVSFNNLSTDSFYWEWNFGDSASSTEQNPVHTYLKPGNFDVILKAYTESKLQWAATRQTIIIRDTVH